MPKGWLMVFGMALLQTAAQANGILINLTNQVWRYDQSGTDLTDAGWQNPAYDDSSWLEGRGVFALETTVGNSALSNNVYAYTNTVLLTNPVVSYFRTRFTFSGDPAQTLLVASNLVDDGYVMYLNGVQASQYNMNAGQYLAAAANPAGEGVYVVSNLCFPPGTLQSGENVLAVAVYQNNGFSSDVVWGTVLHASTGYPPRIRSPSNTVHIDLLQARSTNLIVAIDPDPCAEYQWFFESSEIPGATDRTYAIADMDATKAGTYFALVFNSFGSAVSSNFVVYYVVDDEPPTVLWASADLTDLRSVRVTFSEEVIGALQQTTSTVSTLQNHPMPVITM